MSFGTILRMRWQGGTRRRCRRRKRGGAGAGDAGEEDEAQRGGGAGPRGDRDAEVAAFKATYALSPAAPSCAPHGPPRMRCAVPT
jgi:hypothetical protein